jgi:RHS repeat-associated protein
VGGEMLGVYRIDWENGNSMYTLPVRLPEHEKVYVAGRLLFEGGRFVVTDRLGSAVYTCATGLALQNGGFESGTTNWTPYGGVQQSASTVARSGGLSLRQTTATANAGSYQDITGLIPGRAYQFVAWVRSESGDVSAKLAVSDTTGANMVSSTATAFDSMWWAVQATFTATAEGKARVKLEKTATTGALLWDDVGMVSDGDDCAKAVKLRYYPYGQEVGTATANDRVKFGTYTRDSGSGLDYAMNRYYMSTWGRFTTADPYRASGGPGDPGSWNRYTYVGGDPVNRTDPSGLLMSAVGCVYVGGVSGGGIDVSTNCPPGYIEDWSGSGGGAGGGFGSGFSRVGTISIPACPYPTPACGVWNTVRTGIQVIGWAWVAYQTYEAALDEWERKVKEDREACEKLASPGDMTQPPGPGWEWNPPGNPKGSWVNPGTDERARPGIPDATHPEPHWDYEGPNGTKWWKWPNGECTKKPGDKQRPPGAPVDPSKP